MTPTSLRVALGSLLVLALLDGALCRPHGGPHGGPHSTAPAAPTDELHRQHHQAEARAPRTEQGNQTTTRHHHGQQEHKWPRRQRHNPRGTEVRRICGKNLSDTLTSICAGRGYNTPDSSPGSSTSRRPDVGVSSECCLLGCTLSELEHYCLPGKTSPPNSESASEESTQDAGSGSRNNQIRSDNDGVVPMGNDIRPPFRGNDPSHAAQQRPTVVGEKVEDNVHIRIPKLNTTGMIAVGKLDDPYRHRNGQPIFARHHSISHISLFVNSANDLDSIDLQRR